MKLPRLPTVTELLRLYNVRAMKKLSQNFLLDDTITDRIVRAAGTLENHVVIEVGGGPGALTRSILKANPGKLVCIEKDTRMLPFLNMLQEVKPETMELVHGDALHVDYELLVAKAWRELELKGVEPVGVRVIGNLPFGISSPLLLSFLRMSSSSSGVAIQGAATLTLSFQREFGERMLAHPGMRQRSRLSAMTQYYSTPKKAFDISPKSFIPPPKVWTSVMHITPLADYSNVVPFSVMESAMRELFTSKRQTVKQPMMRLFQLKSKAEAEELLLALEIEPTSRPMTLENFEIDRIARKYLEHTIAQKGTAAHDNIL